MVFCVSDPRHSEGAKVANYFQDMELREEWQDEDFPRSEVNWFLTFTLCGINVCTTYF